ncbi:MAG: esterase family protein [Blautia sp.]|nr:esterase family protein [Blautia sp.]
MEMEYYKKYSVSLGKEVEFKRYGHAGRPVLFIPCQDGRFYDFENFRMVNVWEPWIEQGKVMIFSIDTIDEETWSDFWGNARWRIERYESWIRFITDELVPFMRQIANEKNGWEGYPGIMVTGCSLGASHAANLYFRRPDLFDALLALSGIYSADFGFGTYMDDLVYNNSPIHYLGGMPTDHPYIDLYNRKKTIICCGQGPWEMPYSTRQLEEILRNKGIHAWVDFWGFDCSHDWEWWYKQVSYFVPHLLGEV